jgi:hypothetical protein
MERNILFKCPRTGMNVQHRLPDPAADAQDAGSAHAAVPCLACGALHFVNNATGKLLADEAGRQGGGPRRAPRAAAASTVSLFAPREAERAPSIRVDFAGRCANARPAWLRPPSPPKAPKAGLRSL